MSGSGIFTPRAEQLCNSCGDVRADHVATEDEDGGRCIFTDCKCTVSPEDFRSFGLPGSPMLLVLIHGQYEPQENGPALCRGCGQTSNPGCARDCEVAAAIRSEMAK